MFDILKRKNHATGQSEVSIDIRQFTKNFWQAFGLWKIFEKNCQWAKEHECRWLVLFLNGISVKVKGTMKQADNLVRNILKNLSECAMRTQYGCDKISKGIRNK